VDTIKQEIRLESKYGDRVPPTLAGALLQAVVPATRSSAFMAIEGRGKIVGRPPTWATNFSDIRLTRASGIQGMVFTFEAPTLRSALPRLYDQRDFWRMPPDPDSTALDLLAGVLEDIAVDNTDSERYDQDVLRRIARFGHLFPEGVHRVALCGRQDGEELAALTRETVARARDLNRATPQPQMVRIVGKLDMIRDSTRGFALLLDDGTEIGGTYEPGDMTALKALFQQRVVVVGVLVFRTSGRPLRIDATHVSSATDESTIWSRLPAPTIRTVDARVLHRSQGPRSGLAAIIGKWPGDESEDEFAKELSLLS
jgi:hypothetical protein